MNLTIIILKLINQLILSLIHWKPFNRHIFSLFLCQLQKPRWLYLLSVSDLLIIYHQTLLYLRLLSLRILLILFFLTDWQLLIIQPHTYRIYTHRTILHSIFTWPNMPTLPNIFQWTRNSIFDFYLPTCTSSK